MAVLTATIVGVIGVAPAMATWTPGAASNEGVAPTVVADGRCSKVGSTGTNQFRVNKLYLNQTYVIEGGPTISITAAPNKKSFSWTISPGFQVHDVTVLGLFTPFNHYDYGGMETPPLSDGNLHAPLIGTTSTILAFGYFCWSADEVETEGFSISGRKIEDQNANGNDDDEPGLDGWTIRLFQEGSEGVWETVTGEGGFYSFNELDPGTYTVCEAANGPDEQSWQQSGPLGPENDVCGGEDLAAGGYEVVLEGANVEGRNFYNFIGESLDCGEDTFVGDEGEQASGSFTRVADDCDGNTKGVLTGVEDEEIIFIPRGFGVSNYSGALTFFKDSVDPLLLQYDPGDGGGFRDVPACEDAEFDEGGQVTSASIPEGDNWCFASVAATAPSNSEGQWQVDWTVFGFDDPRFK